jgi:hypothetical protein
VRACGQVAYSAVKEKLHLNTYEKVRKNKIKKFKDIGRNIKHKNKVFV